MAAEVQQNIALIGFMGTGKTTVSEYLRDVYGMDVIDTDQEIVKREGMRIPDIFAAHGEEYFRNLETEFLKSLDQKHNLVISCGGGIVLRSENVEALKKSGKIVLLTASPETILERVQNDGERPILKGRRTVADIRELMELRREKYEVAADIIVDTDQKGIQQICEEIIIQLKGKGR